MTPGSILDLIYRALELAEKVPGLVAAVRLALVAPDPRAELERLLATVGTHDHVAETAAAIEDAAKKAAEGGGT